jgi:uncharacterized protein (TIGR02611 family)
VWRQTLYHARRLIIFIIGLALLLSGLVMLVTPGPGWLLIFTGLGVLALEFAWARHLLRKIKTKGKELRRTILDARQKPND